MDGNFNKVYLVVGARGTGKTPFVIGGDEEPGMAKLSLDKGMSTLVIDEIDHPKYRHFTDLHPKNYSLLSSKPGYYRTLCRLENMPALFLKLRDVWNTLIVFEDCYKYINANFTKAQITAIGNCKQQNNDIIFMHWAWGFVSPDFSRTTNYYIVFKTSDSPEVRKANLTGCYDKIIKAHQIVMTGKKRYLVVDSGL